MTKKKVGAMIYAYETEHEPHGTPHEAKKLINHQNPESWSCRENTSEPTPHLYFPELDPTGENEPDLKGSGKSVSKNF